MGADLRSSLAGLSRLNRVAAVAFRFRPPSLRPFFPKLAGSANPSRIADCVRGRAARAPGGPHDGGQRPSRSQPDAHGRPVEHRHCRGKARSWGPPRLQRGQLAGGLQALCGGEWYHTGTTAAEGSCAWFLPLCIGPCPPAHHCCTFSTFLQTGVVGQGSFGVVLRGVDLRKPVTSELAFKMLPRGDFVRLGYYWAAWAWAHSRMLFSWLLTLGLQPVAVPWHRRFATCNDKSEACPAPPRPQSLPWCCPPRPMRPAVLLPRPCHCSCSGILPPPYCRRCATTKHM